jgi:short-chain fatty acids transporter
MREVVSRLGLVISRGFRATAPDPFVIAVVLLAVTVGRGWAGGGGEGVGARAASVADSFREVSGRPHMWSLLAFGMQMCLVLVSGHALASSRPVERAIAYLADRPASGTSAGAMVALVACLAALVNWGLGLIVGALLAREAGRSLTRRGIPHHYPLLVAAGYLGLMVWHGGLSGSAPLTMTTAAGAARTLDPETLSKLSAAGFGEGVPLSRTLGSSLNLVVTAGLVVLAPLTILLLAPRRAEDQEGLSRCAAALTADDPDPVSDPDAGPIPRWLERSPVVSLVLAGALIAGLWRFADRESLWRLGLNEVNAAMIALGLILHGSPARYVSAVDRAVRGCGGIILQFPIYAAIIAVMINTGLARLLADAARSASPDLLPLATFASAAVINLFVPSGGGQWAVQGPIALARGLDAGVDPGRMILAVAYGDQLTNMLQPFWALPLLAITGIRARDMVGYSALVMLVGGAWIALALVLL